MLAAYLVDVFDLLNVRDLDLIALAAARCSRLIVGVCSDEYAEQVLGRRPVVPADERMVLVSHVRGVSEVAIHDAGTDVALPPYPVFVADDWPGILPGHASVLSPGRRTSSIVLQNALASRTSKAVA